MKQIENLYTYKEAGYYIRKVRDMLKGILSLEHYIKNSRLQLMELSKIAETSGKKKALLSFVDKKTEDYDTAYDAYFSELESGLHRAERTYRTVMEAYQGIKNSMIKDILRYYYVEENTLEDAAEHFSYSLNSIFRYKKIGLTKMAERMFGIVICDGEKE